MISIIFAFETVTQNSAYSNRVRIPSAHTYWDNFDPDCATEDNEKTQAADRHVCLGLFKNHVAKYKKQEFLKGNCNSGVHHCVSDWLVGYSEPVLDCIRLSAGKPTTTSFHDSMT